MSDLAETLPGPRQHVKICTCAHGIKSVLIFHQALVPGFCVGELTFDDAKSELHLAADRGFAVLNQPFPIDGIVENSGQAVRTTVDMVVDPGQMHVVPNLRELLDTRIAEIAVNNLVVLTDQLGRCGHIVVDWRQSLALCGPARCRRRRR